MYPILFKIGNFAVTSHGVFTALSFLVAAWYGSRLLARHGYKPELVWDMAPAVLMGGLVGARLWEVVFTWDYYMNNPSKIVAIWEGGASIQGGIVGGLLAGIWFVRSRKLNFWQLADILAPAILLGQGMGRLTAEVLTGDAYGRPTGTRFGIVYRPGTPAYAAYGSQPLWPAEVFEGIWDLVVMGILLRLLPRKRQDGEIFLLYAILYSLGRFALEFLRGDSLLIFGYKAAQVTSLITACVAAVALWWRRRQPRAEVGEPFGR